MAGVEYTRQCPSCPTIMTYTRNYSVIEAKRNNRKCRVCSKLGSTHSELTRCKLSKIHKGKILSKSTKELIRQANLGKKASRETKNKMSNSQKQIDRYGDNNVARRPEVRDKLRIIRTEQLQKSDSSANYNPTACVFFDRLNRDLKLNGVYATNKGEHVVLGYWLDYYEPSLNLVIEWDEPFHYNKNNELRERDKIRQSKIQQELNCKFIRIKQNEFDINTVLNMINEIKD